MTITYHDVEQGTDEWHQLRCGLLTASEMKYAITPTLKQANNEKTRLHVYELAAQRISKYVEPSYISDDMLRGWDDEAAAKEYYEKHNGVELEDVGFVTRSFDWGTIGYSPDGRISGRNAGVECKSRRQKFAVQAAVEYHRSGIIPSDFLVQCHTGLIVTEWDWSDLIIYSGGMHMPILRVYPDDKIHAAILEAAESFEEQVKAAVRDYGVVTSAWPLTERKVEEEMFIESE